ncbi:hypothetical protein BHM03_00022420, partial [Ensete ventricosum]
GMYRRLCFGSWLLGRNQIQRDRCSRLESVAMFWRELLIPGRGISFGRPLNGEYWKKVFGPVFIYLNSASEKSAPMLLWEDAKKQVEVEKWPYEFPGSEDFHKNKQRGSVSGRLLVQDKSRILAERKQGSSYLLIMLKQVPVMIRAKNDRHHVLQGYQFWVRADAKGMFFIKNVRTGVYNLYAWVPGFIGDYKSSVNITVTSG